MLTYVQVISVLLPQGVIILLMSYKVYADNAIVVFALHYPSPV